MSRETDLLGNPLSYLEQAVLDVHRRLQDLAVMEDAPPCVIANARHALSATWQMVNDLDLDYRPRAPEAHGEGGS